VLGQSWQALLDHGGTQEKVESQDKKAKMNRGESIHQKQKRRGSKTKKRVCGASTSSLLKKKKKKMGGKG